MRRRLRGKHGSSDPGLSLGSSDPGLRRAAVRALPDFLEAQAPVFSLPTMSAICRHCGSLNFPSERAGPGNVFSICCRKGKTSHLDGNVAVLPELHALFTESGERARHFRAAIRLYNSAMSFLSFGLECFNSVPWVGPPVVVSHGTVYHVAGQLFAADPASARYAQLYFYDPDVAAEQRARQFPALDADILRLLSRIMQRCSPYVRLCRQMWQIVDEQPAAGGISVGFAAAAAFDAPARPRAASRRYARPTQSEVAVVFGGRDGVLATNRDIVVWPHQHPQHRVNECNEHVDPLA